MADALKIDALIMAGGQSRRMRETMGPVHKSLVRVLGMTLLERNVRQLLRHEFRNIYIAVNHAETKLRRYIDSILRPLAQQNAASLQCVVERRPLGTIGACKLVPNAPLLVVNADNLTNLNLRQLMEHHAAKNADLTIASHVESFQIPFGQLELTSNNEVLAYLEKPEFPVPISSGTYVVGQAAKDTIPAGQRTDITHAFEALRISRRTITAFRHDSLWIDVNDQEAIVKAEAMIRLNSEAFNHSQDLRSHSEANQ